MEGQGWVLLGVTVAASLAVLAAPGAAIDPGRSSPQIRQASSCAPRTATEAYAGAVRRAAFAKRDVWGEQLLAAPGGPSYEAARRFLAPLLYGTQRRQRPLTSSGVYYVPLSFPFADHGSRVFALHVADGSEIITGRIGGPKLSIYVGRGRERYGACLGRLAPARLAEGYLPILQTRYVDAHGVRYRQESFAGRTRGTRAIVSFVRLTVDATRSGTGAVVRLRPSMRGLTRVDDRLESGGRTRLIVSAGARFAGGAFQFRIAGGESAVVYAAWLNGLAPTERVRANRATYEAARATVAGFWHARLARGAQFTVPEARVQSALRAMLVQQIAHGWRYSVGNPYEELSLAEALDAAEVMAGYGFDGVARGILRFSMERLPKRFTAWRAAERLNAGAAYYRLFRDRAFVHEEAPGLARLVARIEARQLRSGPASGRLQPERFSSDLPDPVDGLTSQIVAWQGLLAMSRVWAVTSHRALAARARRVALRLESALRPAVNASVVRLGDGSLFVPATFGAPKAPFDRITATRDGSYWNLVMPYAFASGFFAPGSAAAAGIIRYLLGHGSRLLGVPRSDGHIIYGNVPNAGTGLGQVYGLSQSRFLADNGEADQLVLSLYGMLAAALTEDTYISGEAVSGTPVGNAYYRTMYMPPNAGATSSFLETLRLMLIHERRGPRGAPRGLDLAFSTPRRWLDVGKEIRVDQAPTSFGRVSFSIERHDGLVRVLVVPPPTPTKLRVRLRLPKGLRITQVRLGERRIPFAAATGTIDLSGRRGPIELTATVARR